MIRTDWLIKLTIASVVYMIIIIFAVLVWNPLG